MKGKDKPMSFSQKMAIFAVVCIVFYTFSGIGNQKQVVGGKEWMKAPKVLSRSVSEDEMDKFPPESYNFIAMIDAGSSGCRAHVYRYGVLGDENGPLYIHPVHDSLKVKPGLSSFKHDPTAAGASLEGLITFMKSKVPENQWSNTPIYLKATAGLRLVGAKERDAILTSVQRYLGDKKRNPFFFHPDNARVISGLEEGAYGWIAVNYLKKTIGPLKPAVEVDKHSAYAVIEMGGASTQVTQLAKSAHDEHTIEDGFKYEFYTQDERLVLYSHSYLGYGAEKAREGVTSHLITRSPNSELHDPCLNPGYMKDKGSSHSSIYEGVASHSIVGVGNHDKCHTAVESAMFSRRHGGADHSCKKNSTTVSFNCIHQPSFVRRSSNIIVFENFFYIASAVGTMPADHEKNPLAKSDFPLLTSPKEFLDSASEVCPLQWSDMSVRYPKEVSQNARWCFSSTYAYLFLTHGIGLHEHQSILVQQSIGGADVEWALGATYNELSDVLRQLRKTN